VKTISVSRTKTDIEAVLDAAQKERVVVTRNGKPSAVIVGIENYDEEELELASSAEFWSMIEQSRKSPSIPLSELKQRLGLTSSRPAARKSNRSSLPRKKR
jgi:prevent-host-death family protein